MGEDGTGCEMKLKKEEEEEQEDRRYRERGIRRP